MILGRGKRRELEEQIKEKNRRLKKLRERLRDKDREIEALRASLAAPGTGGISPENVVWVFGAGRSGTTWLASMMEGVGDAAVWTEPLVGLLFGDFYYLRGGPDRGAKFIMGPRHKATWLRSIRSMVLEGAAVRHPEIIGGGYMIIKEPHGSLGAPLMMEAVPESRMVLLVRDPRDVVASYFDAFGEESWASKILFLGEGDRQVRPDRDPDAYVRERATAYLRDVGKAKEAFDAHGGRKALVRYEDLRSDTQGTMVRMYSDLEIPVDEEQLARAVGTHSWENIPEEKKGKGKFFRKATPGSWRSDLTPDQVRMVQTIAGPLLDEFYPGWKDDQR